MQRVRSLYPASNLPSLGEVSNLVRQGLGPDWVIRIEHLLPDSPPGSRWTAWDKARFAPRDPTSIIDTIHRCHQAYPDHAIRLCAEKLRPETQLVYWIYTPGHTRSPPPQISAIEAGLTTLRVDFQEAVDSIPGALDPASG